MFDRLEKTSEVWYHTIQNRCSIKEEDNLVNIDKLIEWIKNRISNHSKVNCSYEGGALQVETLGEIKAACKVKNQLWVDCNNSLFALDIDKINNYQLESYRVVMETDNGIFEIVNESPV